MLWKVLIILFFKAAVAISGYPEYSIEDLCVLGNESIIYDVSTLSSSAIIKSTSRPPYQPKKDCTIVIEPPKNHGIVLSILKIDMRQRGFSCQDYVQVYHSDAMTSPTIMCRFKFDLMGRISFYTDGPMTIIYHAEPEDYRGFNYEEGFSALYTVVSRDAHYCSRDDTFICDNTNCLPKDKKCDGYNNCGDRSDEAHVLCDYVDLSMFKMVDMAYVVLFAILVFSIFTTCVVTRRKWRANRANPSFDTATFDSTPIPQHFLTDKTTSGDAGLSAARFPPPPPPYSQSPPPYSR